MTDPTMDLKPPYPWGLLGAYQLLLVICWGALAFSAAHPESVLGEAELNKLGAGWLPPSWMVIPSLIGVAVLVVTPKWPLSGLIVFVAVGYGLPRRESFSYFCQWHVLEAIALLTLLGGLIHWRNSSSKPNENKPPNPKSPDKLTRFLIPLMIGLVAWVLITSVIAWSTGKYEPAVNHHPVHMLTGLVLMFVAARVLRTRQAWFYFGTAFGVTICVRAAAAPDYVHLSGDLGILFAMGVCLSAMNIATPRVRVARLIPFMLAIGLLYGLYQTENRGGAVALAAGLITIGIASQYRWKILAAAIPILLATALAMNGSGLAKRFEAIWTGGPDRQSVDSRFVIYETGWRMTLAHPAWGVGLGNFEHRAAEFSADGSDDSPHNNIIGMMGETGFPGATLYLCLFGFAFSSCLITARHSKTPANHWIAACLAGSLVAYMTGGMFMTRHTFWLAYLLVGGVIAISEFESDPAHKSRVR